MRRWILRRWYEHRGKGARLRPASGGGAWSTSPVLGFAGMQSAQLGQVGRARVGRPRWATRMLG